MGILAQHVPSIEQLKPGLVEIIEEAGGSKQFFRKQDSVDGMRRSPDNKQYLAVSQSSNLTLF